MQKLSFSSKLYITALVATGFAVLGNSLMHWQWGNPAEFMALLLMTLAASRLRIKLPGINGVMSVNLPFLLIVTIRLAGSGSLLIAALAGLAQSIPTAKKRTTPVQLLFNVATITNAVAAAGFVSGFASHRALGMPLSIATAGAIFFLANTLPIALVLWLAEGERPFKTWLGMARLSLPYYTLSAGVAAIVCAATQFALWGESLALLPLMYAIYTSYRGYFAPAAAETVPVAESKPMGRAAGAAPAEAMAD
jgi:hypothetical protein